MYNREDKTNKLYIACCRLTALLTGALILIGASVPVFASSIPSSDTTLTFSVDSTANYNVNSQDDTVIVKVPVFLTVNLLGVASDKYISGYVSASNNFLSNFSCTIDGTGANYLYFEPLDNYGITISRPDTYNTRIYFDNYLLTYNSSGASAGKFIGYLVYSGVCTDGNANVIMSSSSWTPTIETQTLKAYDYEAGFTSAIVTALNSASDIDSIINILNSIDSDTGYLPDILTQLQTYYPSFYNYLSTIAVTNTSINTYVQNIFNLLNNIDNSLDTITWNTGTSVSFTGSTTFDGTYTDTNINRVSDIYVKVPRLTGINGLVYLDFPIYNNQGQRGVYIPEILEVYNLTSGEYNVKQPLHCELINNYYRIYFIASNNVTNYIFHFTTNNDSNFYLYYVSSRPKTFYYIENTDIEYWTILNAIVNMNSYSILSEQYNSYINQAEQDKAQIEDSLDQLTFDMTVTKPSAVADIADGYVNQIDTSYNASVFSFLSNSYIILMLCIVFAFAVLSYLLYGGK